MPPSERFSLKDHLFNAQSVGRLAGLFGLGDTFVRQVVAGFPERELKERIDWIADNLEGELPTSFPHMADRIEAALPPPLDPTLSDDDFGEFIFAPLGVLAERHGLNEPDRALDLIEALTQRFSMEFAIRPFLNAHEALTWARLERWTGHPHYHVRRLVSEGTRARLPWAPKIALDPLRPLALLDRLHADPTRYVTRSVANHMGDIAKIDLDVACDRLAHWRDEGTQSPEEMDWMLRHALRLPVKEGAPRAMAMIGVDPEMPVELRALSIGPAPVRIGDAPQVRVTLVPGRAGTMVVDYAITFASPSGKPRRKVFKLKTVEGAAGQEVELSKSHRLKGGATTFTLVPSAHLLEVQVNGRVLGQVAFDLEAEGAG